MKQKYKIGDQINSWTIISDPVTKKGVKYIVQH